MLWQLLGPSATAPLPLKGMFRNGRVFFVLAYQLFGQWLWHVVL